MFDSDRAAEDNKRRLRLSSTRSGRIDRPIGVGGGGEGGRAVASLTDDVDMAMGGQSQPQIHIGRETRSCPHLLPGFDNHIGVKAQGAPYLWRMTFSKDSGESAVLRAPPSVLSRRRFETDGSSLTVSCCVFLLFTTSTSEPDELSFGPAWSELVTFGDRVCLPTGTESVLRMAAHQ